ncbi:SPFH domain-containing protein [Oscillatoria sp. CS-180]|uniref:SPFH domain-containing protein n=1 Tax=Oscillatoria sp. CS-180 TaxID=3021720 RepID=UPI00232BEA77|nr:SPFH domain-containing protein [Oscillatoria sp. CS-180]MDB9524556.1 SPFH domain-containing protein [Oscillatoria sp. CS-180]
MNQLNERSAQVLNGFLGLGITLGLTSLGLLLVRQSVLTDPELNFDAVQSPIVLGIGLGLLILAGLSLLGFTLVEPNQARVLLLLGSYAGSLRSPGFYWVIPYLVQLRPISLRVRNFASDRIKVNDAQGSPIEIATVVVWRVTDSAKALLNVNDFLGFVGIQSEAALRTLANRYSYDSFDERYQSFRDDPDQISRTLQEDVQARLDVAGVEVLEARLTYLAYAPEIAQSMLRRQQALAVVAARERIVEGALGMVEIALNALSNKDLVQLNEERKAAMVNNLLVALVAENGMQPIVNTGSFAQGQDRF